MSKELADMIDSDMSASTETAERARNARARGGALDVDWKRAIALYNVQANQDPKKFARYPSLMPPVQGHWVTGQEANDLRSGDNRSEPASLR